MEVRVTLLMSMLPVWAPRTQPIWGRPIQNEKEILLLNDLQKK